MHKRIAVAALFAVAVSGCVKVNMPDHLVSDAVGAGKDLYHSAERAFSRTPKLDELESNSAGTEFSLATAGSPEASVGDLKRSCLLNLVAQTRAKVGVENLEYKVVDQRVEGRDEKLFVRCQIAIAPKPGA
jgi:hypothetical protein